MIGDKILDLRPINVVVDLFVRRELRARNFIELVQHILPVTQPRLLRRRIYLRQAIGYRFLDSFEPGKLFQPPFPFFCVDSSQSLICALRIGETRDAPQRCSTKQNGGFETHSLPTLTRSYPRRFTFYVADPISSIHHFEQIKNFAHLLAFWQSFSKPHLSATVPRADWSEERRGVETHSFLGGARCLPAAAGELRGAIR